MDIDSITRAIEKLDQDRELITLANGSHTYIEGSTGESESYKLKPYPGMPVLKIETHAYPGVPVLNLD